jgi:hypothetical protein
MTSRSKESQRRGGLTNGPVGRAAQHRIAENSRALANAPRLAGDVLGKMWNAPNETIGWTLGGVGSALGSAGYALGLTKRKPRIVRRGGKTEFVNNPLASLGAVTFGHTTSFGDDPYDPVDYAKNWKWMEAEEGHTVWDHEGGHMPQSEQLGPLYLPSNLAGGLYGLIRDGNWHGPRNWNERGPKSNPVRPWASRNAR